MNQILIIDDESQIRLMLRHVFEREGFKVMDASDGEEGIKLYHKNPADLVITDLIMPGKEGIETIREFRKDFPDVEIIAISGCGSASSDVYLKIAKFMGAAYTFEKPFDCNELINTVKELIN